MKTKRIIQGGSMKNMLLWSSLLFVAAGCNKGNGELIGVQGREPWYQPDPYGMLYIPMGSYNMGPSDQDVPYAHTTKSKTVSVQAFYIDQTEITNNEYRQFVYWVRDSIARRMLVDGGLEDFKVEEADYLEMWPIYKGDNEPYPDPVLNWGEEVDYESDEDDVREALQPLYLPESERFYRRKEIDTRKLLFEYYWIDLRTAAKKSNRFIPKKTAPNAKGQTFPEGTGSYTVNGTPNLDRSVFIIKDVINVYPDTLAWIHDFTYSFNEPMTNMYFWHPAFDDYPVVGVTWRQARAFCIWRTHLLNNFLWANGGTFVQDFRLPTEAEWEYAARGGLDLSPYPWGGPYIRNARGCFLGNFKPMRGSYIDDGGFHTVKADRYNPNDFGLYCMAGNVAEWCQDAYDESAYDFTHDLNPVYHYEPTEAERNIPVLNRKVIRGGSWKDVGYYLQCGTRTYEYQDTAKCYIGFRCVMTYLGRAKDDENGGGL
jgi:formylglycine-generating enzyme